MITYVQKYVSHAKEMSLAIPDVPTLFIKPSSALGDPFPAPTILPKITQQDSTGDYESEMVIVIGKDAKDVPESEALDYVLGYTAANDVSSRTSQMNQSQWCFSKGFDGACPIGMLPLILQFKAAPNTTNRTCSRFCRPGPRCQQVPHPRSEERTCHAGLRIDVSISS